jgi:hypothetical protein
VLSGASHALGRGGPGLEVEALCPHSKHQRRLAFQRPTHLAGLHVTNHQLRSCERCASVCASCELDRVGNLTPWRLYTLHSSLLLSPASTRHEAAGWIMNQKDVIYYYNVCLMETMQEKMQSQRFGRPHLSICLISALRKTKWRLQFSHSFFYLIDFRS